MLRVLEIVMIGAPVILFLVWWRVAEFGDPRRGMLLWFGAGVAVLAAGLIWFGLSRHLPAGVPYHPAQWRDVHMVGGE